MVKLKHLYNKSQLQTTTSRQSALSRRSSASSDSSLDITTTPTKSSSTVQSSGVHKQKTRHSVNNPYYQRSCLKEYLEKLNKKSPRARIGALTKVITGMKTRTVSGELPCPKQYHPMIRFTDKRAMRFRFYLRIDDRESPFSGSDEDAAVSDEVEQLSDELYAQIYKFDHDLKNKEMEKEKSKQPEKDDDEEMKSPQGLLGTMKKLMWQVRSSLNLRDNGDDDEETDADGSSDETQNESSNESSNEPSNEPSNGSAKVSSNESSNGSASTSTNGTSNGSPKNSSNGTSNGTPKKSSNGSHKNSSNGTSNGSPKKSSNGTSNGSPKKSSNGSPKSSSNGSANGSSNGRSNESPKKSSNGSSSNGNGHHDLTDDESNESLTPQPNKRPRGRPPGSKNKPKSPKPKTPIMKKKKTDKKVKKISKKLAKPSSPNPSNDDDDHHLADESSKSSSDTIIDAVASGLIKRPRGRPPGIKNKSTKTTKVQSPISKPSTSTGKSSPKSKSPNQKSKPSKISPKVKSNKKSPKAKNSPKTKKSLKTKKSPKSISSHKAQKRKSKNQEEEVPTEQIKTPKRRKINPGERPSPYYTKQTNPDGQIEYTCLIDDCTKKIVSRFTNFRRHQHFHLGIKPFSCKICEKDGIDYSSEQNSHVYVHIRRHHKEVAERESTKNLWKFVKVDEKSLKW